MKHSYIIILLTTLTVLSCNRGHTEQTDETQATDVSIILTKEQVESEEILIGTSKKIVIEEKVSFSGKIIPKVNSIVSIIAPVKGVVKEIKFSPGENIRSHDPMVKIGGGAIIELQKDFAVSSAKLPRLETKYKRIKTLYDDKIKTEDEFMIAESEYKSELANYTALKLKVNNIGLNISDIERGNFVSAYMIYSPVSGQINHINVMPGQFIHSEDEIAEVVSHNKIELELSFYEKDFSKIAKGQKVYLRVLSDVDSVITATISRVGTMINQSTNTILCYASIQKEQAESLAINQIVNGNVVVKIDTVNAVPVESILTIGNQNYIVTVNNENENGYTLKKEKVETGKSNEKFIELVDFPNDKKILLNKVQDIGIE